MTDDSARNGRPVLSSVLCLLSSATGFTLIELVMTIIIMGFLSLILLPFFNSITRSPDPMIRQRAVALGQALMDEILAKKWDQRTPAGGGPICTDESGDGRGNASYTLNCVDERAKGEGDPTKKVASAIGNDGDADRKNWDDVDDYNSLPLETDNFVDQAGNPFTLKGYTRSVAVAYIASNSNPIDATTAASAQITDTKRIIVTVTSPQRETFNLVAVVCNF